MMVLVRVKNVNARVRGTLSQYLLEVEPCTYIGDVSSRVRESLWKSITSELEEGGSAWMVFPSSGGQKMSVLSYNTTWSVVELDGVFLIERSLKTLNRECDSLLDPG
jgi:CRISPR-associated protein Cas2